MRLYVRVILFYKNIDILENSGSLASLQAYLQIIKYFNELFLGRSWINQGVPPCISISGGNTELLHPFLLRICEFYKDHFPTLKPFHPIIVWLKCPPSSLIP